MEQKSSKKIGIDFAKNVFASSDCDSQRRCHHYPDSNPSIQEIVDMIIDNNSLILPENFVLTINGKRTEEKSWSTWYVRNNDELFFKDRSGLKGGYRRRRKGGRRRRRR